MTTNDPDKRNPPPPPGYDDEDGEWVLVEDWTGASIRIVAMICMTVMAVYGAIPGMIAVIAGAALIVF